MAYKLFIPYINPLHFILENYTQPAQYNSKHFQDYQFEDTIRIFEQYEQWFQPWQTNDKLRLQIHSELGPVELKIYRADDTIAFSAQMTQMQQSFFNPALWIYQCDHALTILTDGYYRVKLHFGSPETFVVLSNWFEVRTIFDSTLMVDYKHFRRYADVYFENGFSPQIRMYGAIEYEKPASKNVVFENQTSDMTLVNTKPYDIFKLYTGGPEGIPNWMIKKYNMIVGCSDLKIDGRYYTKAAEDSQFTENAVDGRPLKGWSIDLRDKLNRSSKIITSDGIGPNQNNLGLAVAINVETKGFVNDDVGGSYYEVQDIE